MNIYLARSNSDSIRGSRTRELIAVAMAFAMVAVGCLVLTNLSDSSSALPGTDSCGDSLTWSYDSGSKTLTITGTGAMTDYTDHGPWYDYANEMKIIVVEEGCTHIGNNAFRGLGGVDSVTLPATSLQSIGNGAFLACYLVTEFSLGKNVSSIGSEAFASCADLRKITVNAENTHFCDVDGVLFDKDKKTILKFPDRKFLTDQYTIPAGVLTVTSDSFQGNQCLHNVTIPSSVTTIQPNAFKNCTWLENFTVDAGNSAYSSQDGVLFDKAKTELISYPMYNSRSSYTVPDTVTTLSANAFYADFYLESIILPANLQHIGGHAFELTQSLKSITIPEKATDLGEALFANSWVQSATIDAKVETLPTLMFEYCSYLTEVKMPATLKSTGESAFLSCSALTSVSIPASVTAIGDGTFEECSALSTVRFPASLKTIEQNAFKGCTALPQNFSIPDGPTSIGISAFEGCTSLRFVTLPVTVKTLDGSFIGCSGMEGISLPDGLTTIGSMTFKDCNSLCYMVIPEGVTQILDKAFDGCNHMSAIYIPTTVTTFGEELFDCGFFDGETELTMQQTVGKVFSHIYDKYQLTSGILFDSMGGSPVWPSTGDAGAQAPKPLDPTKAGYKFAGWFADKECTTPYVIDKIPAGSTFVYAKWDKVSIRPPVNDDSPAPYGIPMAILGAAIVGLALYAIAASLRRP